MTATTTPAPAPNPIADIASEAVAFIIGTIKADTPGPGRRPRPKYRSVPRGGKALIVNDNYGLHGQKVNDRTDPWAVMIPGRDVEHYTEHRTAVRAAHDLMTRRPR